MLDLIVAASFEDIDEADEVAVDVGTWVLDRVTDPGLGGEVYDLVEFLVGEEFLHARAVGNVHLDKTEASKALELLKTALLERYFVVIVEIVEADNLIAARQQAQRGGHADKAGGAGNENFHEFTLIKLC